MNKKTITFDFEKKLNEIDTIIKELESGDILINNAVEKFKQGIKDIKECKKYLQNTQLEIKDSLELAEDNS